MSFEQLIAKVEQAERALEAQERRVAAGYRQLKSDWREAWTPGRIVVAGAISGFLVGRARPLRIADGGNVLQMVGALAGLFAGGQAQAAAAHAEHAAETTEDAVAETQAQAPAETERAA